MLKRLAVGCAWLGATAFGVEAQSSLRTQASFSENPNNIDLYGAETETSNRLLFRQTVTVSPTEDWRVELNVYNLISGASDKGSIAEIVSAGTDEKNRSPRLERHWHDSHRLDGYLTVDRLNARGRFGPVDATLGRFPINLSTTAIFTPNDFFAPFRAQSTYREFKPGVDGARTDLALGQTGQLSAIGVAGFKSDSPLGRVNGSDERTFAYEESSVLARMALTVEGYEVALLGGKLGFYDFAGFSLQGELGPVGVRAEGHQKNHRLREANSAEVAVGFDHRPFEKLLVQIEGFTHGSGYAKVDDYAKFEDDPDRPLYFLGREYGGLAAAWEVTPLLTWKNLVIGNFTDDSALIQSTLLHNFSESGELSVAYTLPRGKGPQGETLRSEFGALPKTLAVETGFYF